MQIPSRSRLLTAPEVGRLLAAWTSGGLQDRSREIRRGSDAPDAGSEFGNRPKAYSTGVSRTHASSGKIGNVAGLFCSILLVVMPVCAQSVAANPVRTVVRSDAKSGRLVRTTIAPVMPKIAPEELNAIVERVAGQEGVEAPLVHSVIRAESNYNAGAVSAKGAQGIMQLIPSTARRFGVANSFDAEENIQGGVRYLRFLLDYYHNDYTKAIAAYNAGEAAVDKYHGVPPYAETLGYVRTVSKHLTAARQSQPVLVPLKNIENSTDSNAPKHVEVQIGPDGLAYYKTP